MSEPSGTLRSDVATAFLERARLRASGARTRHLLAYRHRGDVVGAADFDFDNAVSIHASRRLRIPTAIIVDDAPGDGGGDWGLNFGRSSDPSTRLLFGQKRTWKSRIP